MSCRPGVSGLAGQKNDEGNENDETQGEHPEDIGIGHSTGLPEDLSVEKSQGQGLVGDRIMTRNRPEPLNNTRKTLPEQRLIGRHSFDQPRMVQLRVPRENRRRKGDPYGASLISQKIEKPRSLTGLPG